MEGWLTTMFDQQGQCDVKPKPRSKPASRRQIPCPSVPDNAEESQNKNMDIFHCYEFLLMRRFQEDQLFWDDMKTESCASSQSCHRIFRTLHSRNEGENETVKTASVIDLPLVTADLWFLAVALEKAPHRLLSFLTSELHKDKQGVVRVPGQTVLARYLSHYNFVEMHLDSIYKYGEPAFLPREIFKCKNVRVLSLKYNNLESIPADVGRLSSLERLCLTNNRLQNRSIPFTLTFCRNLSELYLDNNLLDALPGFLLSMAQLTTVHRHGNHNYFKATFMWYHTDVNDRVLKVCGDGSKKKIPATMDAADSNKFSPETLMSLAGKAVIASKVHFFMPGLLPSTIQDFVCDIYPNYNVCENCQRAISLSEGGYKVFTFKNPYLGNTCVPFQHWACSRSCAVAIEVPAHLEQRRAAQRMDQEYRHYIQEFLDSEELPKSTSASRVSCSIV